MKKFLFQFEPRETHPLGLVTRCLLILPPSFLLSLKYDLPHILILASLLLSVPIFLNKSLSIRDRPVVYSLLFAGILAIVPGLLVKIPDSRLTFSDYLMRSHQFLPFLLYSSAIACWFRRTREISSLFLLIALLSFLTCGDVYNTSRWVNTLFAGTTWMLQHYRQTYLVCSAFQCMGVLLLLTADARYDAENRRFPLYLVRMLSVLLMVPLFIGASHLFGMQEETFRSWRTYLQQLIQTQSSEQRVFFPQQTAIGEPPFSDETPVKLVLRAIAKNAPGYLRGNVYRMFSLRDGGFWAADEKPASDLLEITRDSERNLTVLSFMLTSTGDEDTDRIEFRYEDDFRGIITPLPANATSVTLDAKAASITKDGGVVPESWIPATGVIATIHTPDSMAAWQQPERAEMAEGGESRGQYLQLSRDIREQLDPLTFEIFGDGVLPENLSPRQRVDAVVRFFAENFKYSIQSRDFQHFQNEPHNPLLRFLFYRRIGHCELFATSSALLLRMYGVPTRYVCGIVCGRYNPAGYFYATNFDLHAWTEAWLDDEQKWVLVEATPGGTEIEPDLPGRNRLFGGVRDKFSLMVDNVLYWFRRGYPARMILFMWDTVYLGVLDHARSHPVRFALEIVFGAAALSSLFVFLRMRKRKRYNLPHRMRRAARQMRSLQLAIWRRTGIQRESWQSYRTWAEAIGSPGLLDCVARYECLRYSCDVPDEADFREFELSVRSAWKQAKRR